MALSPPIEHHRWAPVVGLREWSMLAFGDSMGVRAKTSSDTDIQARATEVERDDATILRAGDVINGKYVVEGVIGQGAVGVVVAARNVELSEKVALKFLRTTMREQPGVVERFMQEARSACSVKSEYVASIYDVGTVTSGSSALPLGTPFLVMEYLAGEDLGAVLAKRGALEVREVAEYMLQTCEALAVAHAAGVVHRDIKPENMLLTTRAGMKIVKVLDFGISKTVLQNLENRALPSASAALLMGTPLYMSPEQIHDADAVDGRTDIWSLGVVAFELLTGQLPFARSSLHEICTAILEATAPRIDDVRPDVPSALADVVHRCLAKDPADRFADVSDVAVAFLRFAPTRARLCAERAAHALRGAGLGGPGTTRISSTFPPPDVESESGASDSERLRSGARARFRTRSPIPPLEGSPGDPPVGDVSPRDIGRGPVSTGRRSQRRRDVLWLLALGFVAILGVLIGASRPVGSGNGIAHVTPPATPDPVHSVSSPEALSVPIIPSAARIDASSVGPAPPVVRRIVAPEVRLARGAASSDRGTTDSGMPPLSPSVAAETTLEPGGFLTLDTYPWSNVSIDGRVLGGTPLVRIPLPSGKHVLRLDNDAENIHRTTVVVIEPGATLSRRLAF